MALSLIECGTEGGNRTHTTVASPRILSKLLGYCEPGTIGYHACLFCSLASSALSKNPPYFPLNLDSLGSLWEDLPALESTHTHPKIRKWDSQGCSPVSLILGVLPMACNHRLSVNALPKDFPTEGEL
jgi:hypothetical protein